MYLNWHDQPEKSSKCEVVRNVYNTNHTLTSHFYNTNINAQSNRDLHKNEIINVHILNLHTSNDGGTLPGNNNISGTDPAYTIKNHFNTCKYSTVLGSFKARKNIFPRQDSMHPGYFTGTHSDREKLEHFMNTSCGVLNTNQYLSLIHIWRCRRYSLCRSRWSPYH